MRTVTFTDREVMANGTVEVNVKLKRTIRVWLALRLIRVGVWIGGAKWKEAA